MAKQGAASADSHSRTLFGVSPVVSRSIPDNRLSAPLDESIGRVGGDWRNVVLAWRATEEGAQLVRHVDQRVAAGVPVYPADVFRALALTPLERTRVVIVGQDPYHGPGQAQGLAFSVGDGVRVPPSLRNIFKELERDLGMSKPSGGNLEPWARQGVLLLNTSLTVEDGAAASHARRGWERLTDALLTASAAGSAGQPKVFMLWGAHAQAKEPFIDAEVGRVGGRALVLTSNHPSPLSANRPPAPFVGSGHFSRTNDFLRSVDGAEGVIDWRLP